MRRIGADILTHMPAALAFCIGERRAEDFLLGVAYQRRLRADKDEAQVIAQRSQKIVFVAVGVHDDLGLQRRSDLADDTQVFKRFGHLGAIGAELAPFIEQCSLVVDSR